MITRSDTRSPLRSRLAVLSVTTGIFSIVTTEILPIGLLTPIGSEFGVSAGTAGLTMTVPGIVAAVAAPVVTVATGRFDRRSMLCALTAVLALADFLAAAAPAYWVVAVSRVLVGFVIGAFWSIGVGLADRLVRPERAGAATAVVFAAVPAGSVVGVPAGTFIGDLFGWRAAFVVMGVVTAGVVVALFVWLPPLPVLRVTRPAVLRGVLGAGGVRSGLVVTFLVVLAHFAAYTYVTPFLGGVTGAGPGAITVFLLVYGTAGVVGNFAAGRWVRRGVRGTLAVGAGVIAVATALLPVVGRWDVGALVLLVVWGLGYGAVPVCSQAWFARAVPHAPEAAAVVFTSSFQATLSFGALVGGAVVDAASPSAVMVLGSVTAVLAVVVIGCCVRRVGRGR